jgi:hypothetical protein
MAPRRRAAIGIWIALTFSSAVLVHGVIHAIGARAFVWDSPAHAAMLLAALAMLAAVAGPLGVVGPAGERRRRLALIRAGLGPVGPALTGFGLATQAAIAAALFGAEGVSLDPERLVMALVCGLIALFCSSFLFRATRDRVVAVLLALAATAETSVSRIASRRRRRRPAHATIPYRLFVPTRPPPAFAA